MRVACIWIAASLAFSVVALLTFSVADARAEKPNGGKGDKVQEEEEGKKWPKVPELAASFASGPIEVDGLLNEVSWASASVMTEFTQVEPEEDAAPTQNTEVRVLVDKDYLYVGVRAFDAPDEIVARELRHDTKFDSDDHVTIVFDPMNSRRNAYRIRVNPLGARSDGLVEVSKDIGDEWDGIWLAKTRIDEEGWVAEIAIPFKTISFRKSVSTWGFNVERVIRRRNEVVRWASLKGGGGINNVGGAGLLIGLTGMERGMGLDLKLSPTLRRPYDGDDGESEPEIIPSADLVYMPTPEINATLTYKTDFSNAEPDDTVLDGGRFDVFFPEKRDFFLQDAGIFEFGGIKRNGKLFHSRRIGLNKDGEEEIPILAGAKLTGRKDVWSYGVLDVQTEEFDHYKAANLMVARGTVDVFEQSRFGVMLTSGDPTCEKDNTVLGSDVLLRTDEFMEDQTVVFNGWLATSIGDSEGKDHGSCKQKKPYDPDNRLAYGARVEYPNDPLEFSLGAMNIQAGYDPALGFVNRKGIFQYDSEGVYKKKFSESYLRSIEFGWSVEVVTSDETYALETIDSRLDVIKATNEIGDFVKLYYAYNFEDLPETEEDDPHKAAGVIKIDAGEYENHGVGGIVSTSPSRELSGDIEASWGGYYSGTRLKLKSNIQWRPIPNILLGANYEQSWIDIEDENVSLYLIGVHAGYYFSSDLSVSGLVQVFDDAKEQHVGLSGRLKWIIDPGNEFLVSFGRDYAVSSEDELTDVILQESDYTAKLTWTLRL